jgi:hypothetical protein
MNAIKQILKVKDDKITIHLSPELNNTRVEVIILPVLPKRENRGTKEAGLKDLLSIGVWSDSDIQAMEDASKKFNVWTIQSF